MSHPRPKPRVGGGTPAGSSEDRRTNAAVTIQKTWRMYQQSQEYNKMLRKHIYRTKIADEILQTEEIYVQQLSELIEKFLRPLREAAAAGRPIIADSEIRTIFGTVEIIVTINGDLLESLRKRVQEEWYPNQLLGDVFVKMAGLLKIYTDYIQNFNNALNQIQECKKSPTFVEFCTDAFTRTTSSFTDLPSFLITPIQRIPRYQLLLKDLLKHTWKDHRDYKNIEKALSQIANTAAYVDQKKMEAENIQKCMSIQSNLYGKKLENLLDPHRRFVREGALKEVNDKGKLLQKWFILFNDILVYCEMSKSLTKSLTKTKKGVGNGNISQMQQLQVQKLFKYKGKITLERASVVNLSDEGQKQNAFEIVTSRDSLWVCAYSKEDKEEWMKDINECIKETKEKVDKHDQQVTKIAKQRASLTKTLFEEQYAGMRIRGSRDGSLKDVGNEGLNIQLLSLAEKDALKEKSEERLKHLLEEEVKNKVMASEKARDFKKHVASRHHSLTSDEVMELRSEKERKEAAAASAEGKPKRTRKFVAMKRESLTRRLSVASEEEYRNEKDQKKEGKEKKEQEEKKDQAPAPKLRRFAGLKRETWTGGERPAYLSGLNFSLTAEDLDEAAAAAIEASSDPTNASNSNNNKDQPAQPRVRKFASLKRENYKDF